MSIQIKDICRSLLGVYINHVNVKVLLYIERAADVSEFKLCVAKVHVTD
jgi:hypothetical protein